ncbi:hypothetical protein BC941DRAFT_499646 [Chlamydoabsidia padenii]|nr:hypothetical protein BC941DRAFT_499646 [Chlamydoabsidia padenii]
MVVSCPEIEKSVFYLDVCHWIFKDGRRHVGDYTHPVYELLASFSRIPNDNISKWLVRQLRATDEKHIVPYLVWMIDVLKLSSITDEGGQLLSKVEYCYKPWLSLVMDFWQHTHITVVRRSMELMHRWMIQQHNLQLIDMDVIKKLIDYIDLCKRTLSPSQLAALEDHYRTDFFYQPIGSPPMLTLDRECLNWLIQIIVASIHTVVRQQPDETLLLETTLQQAMASFTDSTPSTRFILEFISNTCGSNDQVLIRLQLDILDIHLCLDRHTRDRLSTSTSLFQLFTPLLYQINPHTMFIYFLYRTGMDHELVIDLLMSDETDMLLYLTRYLKLVEQHPHAFIEAVDQVLMDTNSNDDDEDDGIHTVMGLLYQVWVVIRSDLFPYNASVLARRIDSVLECLKQALIE